MATVDVTMLVAAPALVWALRIAGDTGAREPSRPPAPDTPVLGIAFARGCRRVAHRGGLRAGHPTAAVVIVVTALVASGCLSATPPKTPNQREAERHAPRIVVPPPVGEATPRPAPSS